ncbi:MAG: hypothetical protein GF390_02055 [Candidatus Pacebacteria bacterium]|nr:hypothetical protein [Candidatus Paceibacterota bacterium]
MKTVVFDMHNTIYRFNPVSAKPAGSIKPQLPVQEITGALKTLLDFYHQDYQVVIVSRNAVNYTVKILQQLLVDYPEDVSQLLAEIDVLSMKDYGSKSEVKAWKKALKPYQQITDIYEDVPEYLQVAGQAAQELGHKPKLHAKVKNN